jgi:beta-mannosidase
MFACNMYPGDEEFLKNIEIEARENLRRIRNHPSIALYNGNNEVEEGWNRWGWQRSGSEGNKLMK